MTVRAVRSATRPGGGASLADFAQRDRRYGARVT